MSKKRTLSINTTPVIEKEKIVVAEVVNTVSPFDQLNRYLPPHVKYTFDEFVSKFPDKSERIVAHANISDEALLGYVKTLTITSIEQPVTEETEK